MARTPDLQLHAVWRQRIDLQVRGGLSIARFCAQQRLSVATFQSWKRRLRLIDLAERRPAVPAPPSFLPVTVPVAEHVLGETAAIEADLPNGVRLRIPTANPRLACRLVRAVATIQTDFGGSKC